MESSINQNILDFIKDHHVVSLSCHELGRITYSVSLFYTPGLRPDELVFFSNDSTHHAKLIMNNPSISGTIYHETRQVDEIKGLQFTGKSSQVSDPELQEEYRNIYGNKFPVVHRLPDPPWIIRLEWLKFTDNSISFGHKVEWGKRDDLSD